MKYALLQEEIKYWLFDASHYKECLASNSDLYISITSRRNITSNLYREVDSRGTVMYSVAESHVRLT